MDDEKRDDIIGMLRFIFSLISVILMGPALSRLDVTFFRTLFIFLINRVFDMLSSEKKYMHYFLFIWEFINQWASCIVCAIAFCLLDADLYSVVGGYVGVIGLISYVVACSCLVKEIVQQIINSLQKNFMKQVLNR